MCPYQYSKDRVHNTQQTSKQNGKHHNSRNTTRKGVYLACLQRQRKKTNDKNRMPSQPLSILIIMHREIISPQI